VDAWDTGGRVEKSIDKKIESLRLRIESEKNLNDVRMLCAKFNYYVNLSSGKALYIEAVEKYLVLMVKKIGESKDEERVAGVDFRADMLRVAVRHNLLAQACALPRITESAIFLNPDRSFQPGDWKEIGVTPSSIVQ
jgi:hypothetical protein